MLQGFKKLNGFCLNLLHVGVPLKNKTKYETFKSFYDKLHIIKKCKIM